MARLTDWSLLAVTLIGAFLVVHSLRQRNILHNEQDRLARLTGSLPLSDPSRAHVLALETGEPLHFAWRVYLPPRCRFFVKHLGSSGVSFHSDAQHLIARARFREHPPGSMQVYTKVSGGSSQMTLGNAPLAAFFQQYGDQFLIEQLGNPTTAIVNPDQEIVMLKISVPEHLLAKAAADFNSRRLAEKLPLLFEMRIQTQEQP